MNKLSTLEEIVDGSGDALINCVATLDSGAAAHRGELWQALDDAHFDLNTCILETDVLLKSFLLVLPDDQLSNFDFTVCGLARARHPRAASETGVIHPRRIAAVAGE